MNKTFNRFFVLMLGAAALTACRSDETFYSNLLRSDVYVQQYADTKFDFLWVMDNSGSMTARREFIKDNMQSFLNILNSRKAIDFQMAVVTTDMFDQSGDLVQGAGGIRVVKSATSAHPAADFAAVVDAVSDSPTSFWEQGLESAYQAILNHKSEFSRDGVPLIIVFVTDEDDYSCEDHCWGVEPENNPDDVVFDVVRYSDFFKTAKEVDSSYSMVFPIVGLSTSSCSVASDGTRYMEVQETVGGESGSICNSELQASYTNIARVIADRGMVFELSQPATIGGMRLYVDGEYIPYSPENYEYEETNSIVFTGMIPRKGSVIEVAYSQKL